MLSSLLRSHPAPRLTQSDSSGQAREADDEEDDQ